MTGTVNLTGNYQQNEKDITLIWCDHRIGTNDDTKKTMTRLSEIDNTVVFHTELNKCVTYIQSIVHKKILLIMSGKFASELLSQIHCCRQIDSIFIFCFDTAKYNDLIDKCPKLIGIYTNRDSLYKEVQLQMNLLDKQLEIFSFLDQHQRSMKDLSRQSTEFLWFQLFYHVILRLPRDSKAKEQMLDYCRHYYRGNLKQQKLIENFACNYQVDEAIQWYSKQSFIYKLVNAALRSEDIDLLFTFRFFIGDLSKRLVHEHKKILTSGEKHLTVYRGTKFTAEELQQLKLNKNKLITMNGFLSASKLRNVAVTFAKKRTIRTDTLPTLLEIHCPVRELGTSIAFADIASWCEYPDEEEVLFDLNVAFRLGSIRTEDNLHIIEMTASAEGRAITQEFVELNRRESERSSATIMFGRLMLQRGQYDKSQKYFEKLLEDPNDEDLAWIEYYIGQAHDFKGEYEAARNYYDRACNKMKSSDPPREKDLACVLRSIANVLDMQGKHDEALVLHKETLKIYERYGLCDHPDIATSCNNMSNVLANQGKNDEALNYYQRALNIYEKWYPTDHPDIATTLNNIGLIQTTKNQYKEALDYYQRALKIYENYYATDNPDTATTLSNIGIIYEKLKNPKVALEFHTRALTMYEKCLPIGNQIRNRAEKNVNRLLSND